MHILMVKKRLLDGSECRKCQEATDLLRSRGFWSRIDEIAWADERDASSRGMVLGQQLGVDRAPFFIVRDEAGGAGGEAGGVVVDRSAGGTTGVSVYVSVLQLIRERFDEAVTATQQAQAIDVDDIGGI